MTPWRSIDDIPRDRPVIVKSAKGTECLADASKGHLYWVKLPGQGKQQRIACRRTDGVKRGEVSAIAWREPEEALATSVA